MTAAPRVVALHSVLRSGLEEAYDVAHARIPDELVAAHRHAGIDDWQIWRSGRHVFHLVVCEDFDSRPYSCPRSAQPVPHGTHRTHPELVAQIGFAEWMEDGRPKQPGFPGLRDDKNPVDVGRKGAT